jgi:hypothetical protein
VRIVTDLREAARGDDRIGLALAGPHRGENFLRDLAGDRAVRDRASSPRE